MKKMFSGIDNRLKKTMIITFIVIVVIFLLVILIGVFKNKKLSYEQIETKLQNAAISYYEDHPKKLPTTDGGEVTIDMDELVEKEYMKELTKYNKNANKCSGEVVVTLNDTSYIYTPYLDCKEYQTKTFKDVILEKESVINDYNSIDSGLYEYDNAWIYRGDYVNNYVSFGEQMWRILRVNKDGSIRLLQMEPIGKAVWDNRYNEDTKENNGYNDFERSRIKEILSDIYDGKYGLVFTEEEEKYLLKRNICLDAKNVNTFDKSGKITCDTMSIDKYLYSLIDISEYYMSSLDQKCTVYNTPSCNNYNYLNQYTGYWAINRYIDTSYEAFYISGGTYVDDANKEKDIRLVVTLANYVFYESGDGSLDNPYTIKF